MERRELPSRGRSLPDLPRRRSQSLSSFSRLLHRFPSLSLERTFQLMPPSFPYLSPLQTSCQEEASERLIRRGPTFRDRGRGGGGGRGRGRCFPSAEEASQDGCYQREREGKSSRSFVEERNFLCQGEEESREGFGRGGGGRGDEGGEWC